MSGPVLCGSDTNSLPDPLLFVRYGFESFHLIFKLLSVLKLMLSDQFKLNVPTVSNKQKS